MFDLFIPSFMLLRIERFRFRNDWLAKAAFLFMWIPCFDRGVDTELGFLHLPQMWRTSANNWTLQWSTTPSATERSRYQVGPLAWTRQLLKRPWPRWPVLSVPTTTTSCCTFTLRVPPDCPRRPSFVTRGNVVFAITNPPFPSPRTCSI